MTSGPSPNIQAVGGAGIWLVWRALVQPTWVQAVLMLAPLVVVPLGLGLAARSESGPISSAPALIRHATTPAAVTASVAFVPNPGAAAALLTAPWLIVCSTAALLGIGRLASRPKIGPTVAIDVGLLYLAVGAAWLTISRAGANPLNFGDELVQLTAVHFHFAGFALPLLSGVAAQRSGRGSTVPLLAAIGVPLTAVGITVGGTLEWGAATFMAVGGLLTAWMVQRSIRGTRGAARMLLGISCCSLAVGMALALMWAWSVQFGLSAPTLDDLARWHGTLNAIGFGIAGLLGFTFTHRNEVPLLHIAVHLGQPSAATLAAIERQAQSDQPTNPPGLLHRETPSDYSREEWSCPLPGGFEAAVTALRSWAGHRHAGIRIDPLPPIEVGQTMVLVFPLGPLTLTAANRIIEVIDETDRYGFTYATLPHHPEDGEESFIIERTNDGAIRFTIAAVSRPASIASRLNRPVARYLQSRTARRYLAGVTDAVAASTKADTP